jgi:tol-pal system protein YbgF
MKQKTTIFALVFCLGFAACSNQKRMDQVRIESEKNSASLRAENQQLERKVEDLSNTVMVLQDRLETMKLAIEKRPDPAPSKVRKPKSKPATEKADFSSFATEEVFLKANDPKEAALPPLKLSNKDLDRGAASSRKPAHVDVGEPEKASETPEATRIYNEAYRKFESQSYGEAATALESFVQKFPTHSYADNALYWIGESFYRMSDIANALSQFERVVKEYPNGNKVPDALVRAGDCYARMTRMDEAQKSFEKVIQLYPRSVAAEKARGWLAQPSSKMTQGRM